MTGGPPVTVDPLQITTRDELAAFLEPRSDAEINETALQAGVAEVLAKVFDQVARDFDPGNGPNNEVVVQWDVTGPDGTVHVWQLVAGPDSCTVQAGAVAKP